MWQRVLLGAAVVGLVWLALDRESENRVVAGAHELSSDEIGFDVISAVITREYQRYRTESRCQISNRVACVVTTRRAHAQIAAALRGLRRSELTLLASA